MASTFLTICQRVALTEKLRDGEMLDYDGNVVRAGDRIRLRAYGWDVPETACARGGHYPVLRVTRGGQAIVPYQGRASGTMRVRSECMRKVSKVPKANLPPTQGPA